MSKKRSLIWGFSSPPTQKQLTLEESAGHTRVWPTSAARALHISRKVGEMISLDSQPLCIVGDAGFLELLNALEPRYQVPSRKLIPEIEGDVKAKVGEQIKDVQWFSFTSDMEHRSEQRLSAMLDSNIPYFGCFSHTLQLIVNDGVLSQRTYWW